MCGNPCPRPAMLLAEDQRSREPELLATTTSYMH
jgi:hypothetical protein